MSQPTHEITNEAKACPKPIFWQFLTDMNHLSSVNTALTQLASHSGFNHYFLLFCCWFAQSAKGRLTRQEMYRLLPEIRHWHEGIVDGLQRIQQLIEEHGDQTALAGLRDTLLADTALAEQIEQLMLADAGDLKLSAKKRTHGQCLSDACANIINYAQVLRIKIEPLDMAHIATVLTAVFPQIRADKVTATWQASLQKCKKLAQYPREQLAFDL
jgi:hypothetical protein